jgi:RNA-binding protein
LAKAGTPAPGGKAPTYHWLRLRAACHPTEDVRKVAAAMRHVAGLDVDPFQALLKETPLESHHGGTVTLLEAVIDRSRDLRAALQRVLDLPGAREELAASLESRTDEDGIFYVRLDKQEAYQGRLALTRGEDAVQLRLKTEHYPATRQAAMAQLAAMLAAPRV